MIDLRPPRLATAPVYAASAAELPGLRTLAGFPDGPVLDVPWPQNLVTNAIVASEYMVAATVHAKPILAGYTAYAPRSHELLLRAARNLPRPDTVRRLQALTGLRWIVLHEHALDGADRAAWAAAATQLPLVPAHRDDALTIYELIGSELDPRVLAAIRSPAPGATTLFGLSRARLGIDTTAGGFEATVPPALPGYAGDWMKSAVGVRIENRTDAAWPGSTRTATDSCSSATACSPPTARLRSRGSRTSMATFPPPARSIPSSSSRAMLPPANTGWSSVSCSRSERTWRRCRSRRSRPRRASRPPVRPGFGC